MNGQESDASGDDDHKTPKEEKMDVDESGSGGRVTRGKLINVGISPSKAWTAFRLYDSV